MLYNETNNFDEIKTLFPDKTEIEVVIKPRVILNCAGFGKIMTQRRLPPPVTT